MAVYEHIPEADTYYEAVSIVINADHQDQKLALTVRTQKEHKEHVVVIGISGVDLLRLLVQARAAREAQLNIQDWQPYRPA